NGSACDCKSSSRCGDGIVEPPESCDPPGTILPNGAVCRGDCSYCGDGLLNATDGETCDPPGSLQQNGNPCSSDCTYCGDGIVQAGDGEECEPPATSPNPYCPNVCTNACTCLV